MPSCRPACVYPDAMYVSTVANSLLDSPTASSNMLCCIITHHHHIKDSSSRGANKMYNIVVEVTITVLLL